jgi:predicted nucleic acid-binding protein
MLLVVADTGPIRYLVQIDQINLLVRLFEKIVIPDVVADELRHPSAPVAVQDWINHPPDWLKVSPVTHVYDPVLKALDPGERAAIALGLSLKADLILIDDRKGASVAMHKGCEITGTLGVLDLAARRRLINLRDALDRLKRTSQNCSLHFAWTKVPTIGSTHVPWTPTGFGILIGHDPMQLLQRRDQEQRLGVLYLQRPRPWQSQDILAPRTEGRSQTSRAGDAAQ